MFEFLKRDEGVLASIKATGVPVADITTRAAGKDGKLASLAKKDWIIHFTANRLTMDGLVNLVNELNAFTDPR